MVYEGGLIMGSMALPVFLLLVGAVLLTVEIFIPGFGVFGILGIAMIVISSVVAIVTVPFGIFFVGFELAGLSVAGYHGYRYFRKHQLHSKIILNETLRFDEERQEDFSRFLGKEGVSLTSLRPFGMVDFNGMSVDAYADGEYIAEHTKVKVISADHQKVTVKQLNG